MSAISPQNGKRQFQLRLSIWRREGLSTRAATALALAGCETLDQIRALSAETLTRYGNVGTKTLAEIAALIGGWGPQTPQDAIAKALCLSIPDEESAQEAAGDALIALRRSGFVVISRRTEPRGSRHDAG